MNNRVHLSRSKDAIFLMMLLQLLRGPAVQVQQGRARTRQLRQLRQVVRTLTSPKNEAQTRNNLLQIFPQRRLLREC